MADVELEVREKGIAWITLNRPDSLNSMGGDLLPLLERSLASCGADRSVRCIVLTGAGRAFSAGGDVKKMSARSPGEPMPFDVRVQNIQERQCATTYVLHTMPKPTIAMVNGHAVGGGFCLALACDIRIASMRARFGTGFRNVALSGDFGGSWFLPRLVGPEWARRLYFTGEIIDALNALELGLVSQVVPHDDLEQATMHFARLIASGPRIALSRMKANLNSSWTTDLRTALDNEALNTALSLMTSDHQEAVQAFVEKRTPGFENERQQPVLPSDLCAMEEAQ